MIASGSAEGPESLLQTAADRLRKERAVRDGSDAKCAAERGGSSPLGWGPTNAFVKVPALSPSGRGRKRLLTVKDDPGAGGRSRRGGRRAWTCWSR